MRPIRLSATMATCLAAGLLAGTALPSPGFAQSTGSTTATPPASTTTPSASTPVTPKVQRTAARPSSPNMQAMVEQRIKDLHSRLHITAAEEPQWTSFAQVMRDNAKTTDALYEARQQKMGTMTATDNMQSYAEIAKQHDEDMQKLLPAFQTLYGSFSDAQKKQADEVFRSYAEQREQSHAAKK